MKTKKQIFKTSAIIGIFVGIALNIFHPDISLITLWKAAGIDDFGKYDPMLMKVGLTTLWIILYWYIGLAILFFYSVLFRGHKI